MSPVRKLLPTRFKIFIIGTLDSVRASICRLVGRWRGIKIVRPDPKIPNYYVYKHELAPLETIVDVGCGSDPDLSRYMINKYGIIAVGIDPTLKHADILRSIEKESGGKFKYLQAAITSEDGVVQFSESLDNMSGSILESHRNIRGKSIKKYSVKSISLRKLPEHLGLSKISYIKLDLEGAEYELLDKSSKEDFEPYREIFIEFHHHAIPQYSKEDTLERARKMKGFGFNPFSIDEHNFLFYR